MAKSITSVIIPAAGISKRFSSSTKKQFFKLNGLPLLFYCINVFEKNKNIDEIVVATHAEDIQITEDLLKDFSKVKKVVAGGEHRHISVYNAFNSLSEKSGFVLIHDAARPFITDKMIDNIMSEFDVHDAVICGIPIYDTVKEVETNDNTISSTIPREKLWRAQTPQAFKYGLLKKIYSSIDMNSKVPTDESKLAEDYGTIIKITEGSEYNLKITNSNDLKIAESYIKNGLIENV